MRVMTRWHRLGRCRGDAGIGSLLTVSSLAATTALVAVVVGAGLPTPMSDLNKKVLCGVGSWAGFMDGCTVAAGLGELPKPVGGQDCGTGRYAVDQAGFLPQAGHAGPQAKYRIFVPKCAINRAVGDFDRKITGASVCAIAAGLGGALTGAVGVLIKAAAAASALTAVGIGAGITAFCQLNAERIRALAGQIRRAGDFCGRLGIQVDTGWQRSIEDLGHPSRLTFTAVACQADPTKPGSRPIPVPGGPFSLVVPPAVVTAGTTRSPTSAPPAPATSAVPRRGAA